MPKKTAPKHTRFARRPFQPDERLNALGGILRRIRAALGWSQSQMAVKCQLAGWNIDRVIVAKIESHLRAVSDWELLKLCEITGALPGEMLGVNPLPRPSADMADYLKSKRKGVKSTLQNLLEP
jgi:transcriptional regulator with XRE-family HTH domain